MSYKHPRRLYDVCVFQLFIICWLVAPTRLQAQVVSARVGQVCHIRGEVLYHRHEEKGVRQLHVGATLNDGDIIFTTGGGRAEWSLTTDSYLQATGDSQIVVRETRFHKMRFDVMKGEVLITLRSLEKGASLVISTPPAPLTIYKPGIYRILVAADGETGADVGKGELRYVDRRGRANKVKAGKRVHFYKVAGGDGPTKGGEGRVMP